MSKKLFYARGQSDAARGRQPRFIHGTPDPFQWAYMAGYHAQLFARANRAMGSYLNGTIRRNNLPQGSTPDITRIA